MVGVGSCRLSSILGWADLGLRPTQAAVAQLVERVLGKDEVMGPSPISSFLS